MIGFIDNIEKLTAANTHFRQVVYTGQHAQLVVMSLLPGEDIGMETHETTDQFLRIESGKGIVITNGDKYAIADGSAIVIPAGIQHNLTNTSKEPMKLYTLYSPPHHKDGTIHATKEDALGDKEDHL